MGNVYDKYYQTDFYFGDPYPELIDFYSSLQNKGKLLDIGCGQGRNAIPLARMGYEVTGVDVSEVGIRQMNNTAKSEDLPITGIIDDFYKFDVYNDYQFILLDSIFHFGKKERSKETQFLNSLLNTCYQGTLITICIQDTGNKLEILDGIISDHKDIMKIGQVTFHYEFQDRESNHTSKTKYEMIHLEK